MKKNEVRTRSYTTRPEWEPMKRLDKKNIEDILALTPMQEGMLFHYLKDPGSDKNFEQLYLEISGKMDIERFRKAWNFVTDANEMLRTVFWWERVTKPIQLVLKKHTIDLRYFDISENDRSKNEPDKLIEDIKSKEREKKLDLFDVPFRVTLCKMAEDKYGIIISHHHILYDGWSNSIILSEFFNAYENLSHQKAPLKPVKGKFKEFIMWIQIQDKEAQKKFWKAYLEGFEMKSGHPVKRKEEVKRTAAYRFQFQDEARDKIYCFVKEHKISVSSLLYSAWGILLQKYNGCEDVLFDTTVSGRLVKVKGIENMVGLFINTLPVRVKALSNEKLIDVLYQMKDRQQGWEAFENTSPAIIKEHLDECRSGVFFDSVLVIENYPVNIKSIQENSEFSIDSFSNVGMTHYDLTVLIAIPDSINIEFIYNKDLFDEEIAAMVTHHFVSIVETIVTAPQQTVRAINIPSTEERDKIASYFKKNRETEPKTGAEYAPPRNEAEEKLVEIWSDMLNTSHTSPIGIDDNFFDFGGHSLKASILATRIHREFNVKIPLAEIFKGPTIREMAECVKKMKENRFVPIKSARKKEVYPLTSAQKRLYILQEMDSNSTVYNGSLLMEIEGELKINRLTKTFLELIKRHESLRTSFEYKNGEPMQRVHDNIGFNVEQYRLEGNQKADEMITQFKRPFNLGRAPLFRVGLIKKVEEKKYIMMVDIHHIICDGVSRDILMKEFAVLYKGDELPTLELQYKDFLEWKNGQLQSGELKQQEESWLEQLSGELPLLDLPYDFPRPSMQNFEGDRVKLYLEKELKEKLDGFIKRTGTTLFMVLLSVYNIVLSKYSRQYDILVGSPAAGRTHADLENIIGLLIDTLVIRSFPKGEKTFEVYLSEVKKITLKAYDNQDYPFRELVRQVVTKNDLSRNPLFTVMLNVLDQDLFGAGEWDGLKVTPYPFDFKVSWVDLTVEVTEIKEGIIIEMEYCTALFKRTTIEMFGRHFISILEQVLDNPEIRLQEIEILNETARGKLKEKIENRKKELKAEFSF